MDAGTGFTDLSGAGPFTGTTTDTLTITNPPTTLNNNNFRVILTNSANCSDTSATVKLNVWPTGVSNILIDGLISVYPNPSEGNFTLDLGNVHHSQVMRIEIYDLAGRRVYLKELKSGAIQTVSTGISQKGMYLLRLTSGGNPVLKQSLIIR